MRYPLLLITIFLTAGVYTASILLGATSSLDFTDRSTTYIDSPFVVSERAAINVLTNLGVIRGNPDGSFHPERNLNRAEFVKVALLSHPSVSALVWGPITCFADVLHQDWFSPYVCAAKEKGIVQGYGDGLFRPGKLVTYAEAIKILTVLYDYHQEPVHAAADPWYAQYVDSASSRMVLLPESVPYDTEITRGQMARLAAAFRAEYEGELDTYRVLEGRNTMVTEKGVVNGTNEVEDINSIPAAKDANGAKEPSLPSLPLFPSQSHLLLLGQESPPIADGIFRSPGEDADIAIMQVVLDREVKSINELIIVDDDGVKLSWPLRLYGFDEYNKTFRWEFEKGTEYILPANTDRRFFVKARMWERGNRGISEELIEVREFSVVLRGQRSGQSLQIFAKDAHFPFHQTVQSMVSSVMNAGTPVGDLQEGRGQMIASFRLTAIDPENIGVWINHLTLLSEQSGVKLMRLELEREGRLQRIACYTDGLEDESILCPNLPEEMGIMGEEGMTLLLFADIHFLPIPDRHLQVRLEDPGTTQRIGAIQWSDRVGSLRWIEGEQPLAMGTYWK